jgi:hypothetical protein
MPDTSKISCDFINELLKKSLEQHKELLSDLAEYLHRFDEYKRNSDSFYSSQCTYDLDIWVRTLTPSGLINVIAWLVEKIDLMENNS